MTTEQMINRAESKGYNRTEATARLAELTAAHDGENLACALVYNSFATLAQARKFAGITA